MPGIMYADRSRWWTLIKWILSAKWF